MKRCIADGSVGFPHVRVGHRQAFILKPQSVYWLGFFYGGNPAFYLWGRSAVQLRNKLLRVNPNPLLRNEPRWDLPPCEYVVATILIAVLARLRLRLRLRLCCLVLLALC